MSDLVTWLRQQLDEDEWWAVANPRGPWHAEYLGGEKRYPQRVCNDAAIIVAETFHGGGINPAPEAEHIARHDPARVLAEVEAKRRILDLHRIESKPEPDRFVKENFKHGRSGDLYWETSTGGSWQPTGRTVYACINCDQGDELYFDEREGCDTVRLLALPYRDRTGFDTRWLP